MGAVLEMRRTILGAAALLALAACSQGTGPGEAGTDVAVPSAESRALGIVGQVRSVFGGIGSNDAVRAPRSVPGGFTPEAIAAEPGAYRLVQINALGLQEPARVIQENGPEITLAFQSGPTAAYDGGILVATRGFGDDLITMESAGVLQALRSGGGTVTRRMETLDPQDQVLTDSFACTIAPAGTEAVNLGVREATLSRFNENCRSATLVFDNIYWLDGSGDIVASRQYVSPTVAYLRSNRL
jgi:group 4 capsule polysaccharide lipoprotein GfcB/YjbF